jgi:hypothetical protein
VSDVENRFSGQDGGVCTVTAALTSEEVESTLQTELVALRLNPWRSLAYDAAEVTVTVGSSAPRLLTAAKQTFGLLRPSSYSIACSSEVAAIGDASFVFDAQLGAGFLAGHPLLEFGSDGSIAVSPASSMTALFDSQDFVLETAAARKEISLACRVYGHFTDRRASPVSTALRIRVKDNFCFVQQLFLGRATLEQKQGSLTECRLLCRNTAACSHYSFAEGLCRFYARDTPVDDGDDNATGHEVAAWAKIPDCSDDTTCVDVPPGASLKAYLAGRYCPIGLDASRGMVYKKQADLHEETLYLVRHAEAAGGGEDGAPRWTIRSA